MSEVIYDKSQAEWDSVIQNPEQKRMGETWLRDDTLDYWRHLRMRTPLKAFVAIKKSRETIPSSSVKNVELTQCFGSAQDFMRIRDPKNVHTDPDPRG